MRGVDMWTMHVAYSLAILLTAWIAYRVGVAVEASRADDELQAITDERDTLTRKVDALYNSRTRWRDAAVQTETSLERERALSARLMDRLLPPIVDDGTEPMTTAQADAAAVRRQREAQAREEAMTFDGREPVAIQDDEAEPPPRLRYDEVEGDDDPPG